MLAQLNTEAKTEWKKRGGRSSLQALSLSHGLMLIIIEQPEDLRESRPIAAFSGSLVYDSQIIDQSLRKAVFNG